MIEVKEYGSSSLRKKLEFNYPESFGVENLDEFADRVGKYPFIAIDGVTIEPQDIQELILSNNEFIPTFEMKFKDPTYRLLDKNFPLDDTIVSIYWKDKTYEMATPVRMDFKIMEINPNKISEGEREDIVIDIKGELNVNFLYYTPFKAYKGTSYDVIKGLASEAGLGFASNFDKTDDEMKWINSSILVKDFIRKIVKYSYKADDTFLFSFIDFYYNLNYIDIEKQLQDNKAQEQNMPSENMLSDPKENDGSTKPLILTNHPDKKNDNTYIDKYNLVNESTNINLNELGYKYVVYSYDKTDKDYKINTLDTISTTGKDGNQIIMKGNTDNELYENNYSNEYLGKLDQDNVHKNFLWARRQNYNNNIFLQKIRMKVQLNLPNYYIYRFQPVEVVLYKTTEPDQNTGTTKSTNTSDPNDLKKDQLKDKINQKLSGTWLVTGINFIFRKDGGNIQEVTLVKRELTSEYIPRWD